MITITREQMIAELTHNEMQFLAENPYKHNVTEVAEFFTKGGFNVYSDEQLNKVYDDKFGED